MEEKNQEIIGLTSDEVKYRQEKYGKNELESEKNDNFFHKVLHIFSEPMFMLLIVAAIIYFILGESRDGAIMLIFVLGIIGIDIIQEWRTDKTLNALKDLSAPHVKVIRNNKEIEILSKDLVPGDLMIIYEGVKIPADGFIIKCNDLCVDESSLTGEAEGVWKIINEKYKELAPSESYWRNDYCYAGTLVIQGTAIVQVDKIGIMTEYGKIGKNIAQKCEEFTPLQKQTGELVKLCAGIAGVLFALVGVITYFNLQDHIFKDRIIESILAGITITMAMIPEEFPVILTVFLSIGAWRLAKKKSLVRKLPAVETLGAISVLCVDKTGTITMNQMTVQNTWSINGDEKKLCEVMGLACETDAYDPMEKAMINYCEKLGIYKEDLFGGELIKEYPFTNKFKIMGHVWQNNNEIVTATKGSPENLLKICDISKYEKEMIESKINEMSKQGLRVIAVGVMKPQEIKDVPEKIMDCSLKFCGLIGLSDPPRENVKQDIAICNKAGIRVVMITGDNGITATSIAKQVGIPSDGSIITGDMINQMTNEELREKVKTVSIFSRVIPEHKMRIVKAFKDNGEIVAMTGDGVNDAPALKYADIGIAMGQRGSEVSREAADLILMDDNFSTIVDTVKDGRRIYDNIRKAVGYVFTIHIPIALASLFAPILGVNPASLLLLPIHVVLLELIIDPTCSIVLERQPAETDIMDRKPRNPKEKLLTRRNLIKSILQGIVIFIASFGTYYTVLSQNWSDSETARTMGLVIIMFANLFLVQVNSSNKDFAFQSIRKLMKDRVMWAINIITFIGIFVILYTPINSFLKLAPLTAMQLLSVFVIASISVLWYEIVKLAKRKKIRRVGE